MWTSAILLSRVLVIEISEDLIELGLHFLNLSIVITFVLLFLFLIWCILLVVLLLLLLIGAISSTSSHINQLLPLLNQLLFSALLLEELRHILKLSSLLWELATVLSLLILVHLLSLGCIRCRQSKPNVLLQI